ncbi:MAG: flavin reductase [Clostridiales bacterium]|nr:MAG: flavin reductase [Clostridiales bacterium]
MAKRLWKPGTMLYPLPAVMVSCGHRRSQYNIITIAWTGTICSDPAMAYISVRPSRYSYDIIKKCGDFVINVTTADLAEVTDYCGVVSGRDVDKFEQTGLTPLAAKYVKSPLIKESPISIECKLKQIVPLGTHDMFVAEVLAVQADESLFDEHDRFCLEKSRPLAYSHGEYFALGEKIGKFGYSIQKKNRRL